MSVYKSDHADDGDLRVGHYPISQSSLEDRPLVTDQLSLVSAVSRESSPYSGALPKTAALETSDAVYKTQSAHKSNPLRYWNPIWLTKTVLCVFVVVFGLLVATLITLYTISVKRTGLVSQRDAYRYTWTYGPTAVLVLVASLWMRVEYWCKALTPFHRMRKATTPAEESILQDYLSRLNIVIVFEAFKNGDFVVCLATTASALLQLTIIISTSLLFLESQGVTRNIDLPISTEFRSSAPNISTLTGLGASRYYGIQANRLPYPATASSDVAVEDFYQRNTDSNNISYTASVTGMSASLDCEIVDLGNKTFEAEITWQSILAPGFATNITTGNCTILGVPVGMGANHDPPHTDITVAYQGYWSNYTCNDGQLNYELPPFPDGSGEDRLIIPGFNDKRIVFTTSMVQWTPDDLGNTTRRYTWVQELSCIVCKPSYSMDDYVVTYPSSISTHDEPFTAVKAGGKSRKIDGLTDDDLTSVLNGVVENAAIFNQALRTELAYVDADTGYLRPDDRFFILMSQAYGNTSTAALLNATALREAATKAFSGTMAQIFDDSFRVPSQKQASATSVVAEDRLVLKTLPTALMVSFLTIVMAISIAILRMRPYNVVPIDPQTISSRAKLLAASSDLSTSLQHLNGERLGYFENDLLYNSYHTTLKPAGSAVDFVIDQSDPQPSYPPASEVMLIGPHHWWAPMTTQLWFMGSSILVTLAIIVALEIIQRVSNSKEGIANFQEWGSTHTIITAIPAAVLSGVALMYVALDFNIRLMAPFTALKHAPVSHQRGLDVALIGKPSVHSLYLAIRHWMPLPILSTFAIIIGSFLAIVVSGLYYTANVPLSTSIQLSQTDAFNYSLTDLSRNDNFAGLITSLIYYQNSSYPPGTYNNLVFPSFDVSDLTRENRNASQITIEVPAVRPWLDCISIPSAQIGVEDTQAFDSTAALDDTGLPQTNISTFVTLPCYENVDGTGNIVDCKYPWWLYMKFRPGQEDELISNWVSQDFTGTIPCKAWPPGNETYPFDLFDNEPQYPLANGCPTVLFGLGSITSRAVDNSTLALSDFSVNGALCFQRMEQVQTMVTYDVGPSAALSINTTTPPSPIESTAKQLNFTSGNYTINLVNYTGPVYVNTLYTLDSALLSTTTDPTIGSEFTALAQGEPQLDLRSLLGSAGFPKVTTAAQDLYATYMTQAINANFRYNLSSSSSSSSPLSRRQQPANPTFTGTATDLHRLRLKQQPTLKLLLQIMLGVMALCALTVYLCGHRTPILPHNPCTLAGSMILLAGSEMANSGSGSGKSSDRRIVPRGAEWSPDNSLWEGWFFSLGWWGTRERWRYGVDVGHALGRWEDLPSANDAGMEHRGNGRGHKGEFGADTKVQSGVSPKSLSTAVGVDVLDGQAFEMHGWRHRAHHDGAYSLADSSDIHRYRGLGQGWE